ncbi:MAG: 4-(cytidine 5'-diphospho)-2-C-methyl-D-erythritol kinase [Eubacteriales bacterium]
MGFISEKAYAKINLYLDIESRRDDGYHNIITIMQLVSLCDEVLIDFSAENARTVVEVKNSEALIDEKSNLAYIASETFYGYYKKRHVGAINYPRIEIIKSIPVAAGLGGGSADAAAVLRGLNKYYGKPFTTEELCEMGLEIGSDVPFCIVGGVQVCRGRGEVSVSLCGIHNYHLLIACGDKKDSTKEQYRRLDELFYNFERDYHKMAYMNLAESLTAGRLKDAFKYMYNIFGTLYGKDSGVEKIKRIMTDNGACFASLTGSGPSVYGIFPDSLYAEDAQMALERENIKSYICLPINLTFEKMEFFEQQKNK